MPRAITAKNHARAFTIIELLVSISIIAMLVALLLPAIGKAKDSSRTVLCASNQRQLGIGMATYSTDFQNSIPLFFGTYMGAGPKPAIGNWQLDPTTGYWFEVSSTREWFLFYGGYVAPRISTNLADERKLWNLGLKVRVFDCPSTDQPTNYGFLAIEPKTFDYRRAEVYESYDDNGNPTGPAATRLDRVPARALVLADSLSKVAGEGTLLELANANEHPQYAVWGGAFTAWYYLNGAAYPDYAIPTSYPSPVTWASTQLVSGSAVQTAGIHHNRGSNLLTADGAARWHTVTDYLPYFFTATGPTEFYTLRYTTP